MRSNDQQDFTRQVEVLCAGFNVPPTELRVEALWRGLQAMDLLVFTRVVECALAGGTEKLVIEKMPTSPQLWNLSRQMKSRAPAREPVIEPPPFNHLHAFGQRALLVYLREHSAASGASLERLVAAKNRIVEQFRLIEAEEPVTAEEMRSSLFRAFDREFDEASFDETEEWRRQICRERMWHFVPRSRPAA